MTTLFSVIPVPVPSNEPGLGSPIRVINQNFRSLADYLNRAISGATLIAAGSITVSMLSSSLSTFAGDLSGTLPTGVVVGIRSKTLAAPAAGDDGKALCYDHAGGQFVYTDKVSDVLTTRGDIITRGASAEQRLAVGGANTLLKSDGTDPGWGTLTALIDSAIGSTRGSILTRTVGGWTLLTPGTSGYVLASAGAGADIGYVAPSAGTSPLTTKGDLFGYSTLDARIPVGTDGQVLTADSTQALGLKWATPGSSSSPLTTKGDLFGFSTVDARLAVGTDGYVLTADSTQALGIKWAAASGGSNTLLDGSSHTDTVAGTVVRGDLITGNSTPKWSRFAIGSLRNMVLRTNDAGTDIEWSRQLPWRVQYIVSCYDMFASATKLQNGLKTTTAGGTQTVAASADTSRVANKYTNTAIAATYCGMESAATLVTPAMNVVFACDFKLVTMTSANGCCWQAGVAKTSTTSTGAKAVAANHPAVLSFLVGTDTNFMFRTGDGTTATEADTGVTKDANWHDLVIYTADAGTTWVCELDGVEVARKTSNPPGTTQVLLGQNYIHTAGTNPTSIELRTGYMYLASGKAL